jgi:Cu/Zn superoxide dismutase
MMRSNLGPVSLAALSAAAMSLAACNPPHPHWQDHWHGDSALKTISSLDCPDRQGELTRKSAAADGKSCVYASDAGAQVTLQLISLDGQDTKTALAPLEASLQAELPTRPAGSTAVATSASGDNERVNIDLPGIHIHANGDGRANIDASGVNINADGRGAHVETSQGPTGSAKGVTIDANNGGAQIRVNENGDGVHMSYILASDTPGPHGYRMAAYEARGPSAGPLAVASILAKDHEGHDELRHEVRDLLARNVGG